MEDMVVNGLDRQSVDFISAKVNHILYILLNFRIYHKELFFPHSNWITVISNTTLYIDESFNQCQEKQVKIKIKSK